MSNSSTNTFNGNNNSQSRSNTPNSINGSNSNQNTSSAGIAQQQSKKVRYDSPTGKQI